jgi:hypothetical protein
MAFPERNRVVAEFLGAARRGQSLGESLRRAQQSPGDGVLDVRKDVEDLELHAAPRGR